MKTYCTRFLLTTLAISIMAGCGSPLDARADSYPNVMVNLFCYHEDPSTGDSVDDYDTSIVTNGQFQIRDSFRWVGYLNDLVDGAFAYYDLERNFDGTNVNYIMRMADAHIDAPYADNIDSMSGGAETLQIGEDMMMVYLSSSTTDLPPTQVSFQISYSVQGQSFNQLDDYTTNSYEFGESLAWINSSPGNSGHDFYANTGVGSGVLTPVSAQLLTPAFTVYPNTPFPMNLNLQGNDSGWASDQYYTDPNQPATLDLRFILNGFVNIVDQNNQTIPLGNVAFYFVNATNANDTLAIPNPANPAGQPTLALQAITGTNGLIIQWPSYATNCQLQTTANLASGVWSVNGLPAPVQSGPFLQVAVPTTNAAAFFHLQQTN